MSGSLKTIMVDDELWMLKSFEDACRDISAIKLLGQFKNPVQALEFAQKNQIDIAFVDLQMRGMTGTELASALRELYPELIVIFISAYYEKYALEAIKVRADGYVMKPYNQTDVEQALQRALLLSGRLEKRVYVHTFGNFEVFVNKALVKFSSAQAKELLAYYVDRRGEVVSPQRAFEILYGEEREYNNYNAAGYRQALQRLIATLEKYGIADILVKDPKGRAVNPETFDCDYYQFLNGDPRVVRQFNNHYMDSYSWGEFTLGTLTQEYLKQFE